MKLFTHSAGTLAYSFSQWLIIFVINQFIGLEGAGLYALYMGWLTAALIAFNFGLRQYISGDVSFSYNDSEYLTLRYVGLLLFLIISVLLLPVVESKNIYMLCLLTKLFDSMSDLVYGNWNRHSVVKNYAVSQVFRLVLFIVLIVSFDSVANESTLLFLYPSSMLIVYFLYDNRNSKFSKYSISQVNFNSLFSLVKNSIPFAIGSLVLALNVSVLRQFISYYMNNETLAYYVYLVYYYTVFSMVVLSLGQINIPKYAKIILNNGQVRLKDVKNDIFFVLVVSVFCVIFYTFAAEGLTKFLYSVESNFGLNYSAKLAMGVAFGFSFFSVYLNSILVSMKSSRKILIINFAYLIFTLILCILYLNNDTSLSDVCYLILVLNLFLLVANGLSVYFGAMKRAKLYE
jgi:O-antigen/teichoic acid export membrane protein